jgi:hypothetical protein
MEGGFIPGVVVGVLVGAGGYYFAERNGLIGGNPAFDFGYTNPAPAIAETTDPLTFPTDPAPTPVPFPLDIPQMDPAPLGAQTDPGPEPAPLEPPIDLGLAPAPAAPAEVTLVPEAVTPGLLFDWTGGEALAPLSIVTSPGRDYYVKLVYAGTNDAAIGIYVQGGVTSEITVPLGSYEMRYASGTTWYGYTDLFGPETAYSKAVGTFDFRDEGNQYTGYTVELILQEGGNLGTEGIGAAEF